MMTLFIIIIGMDGLSAKSIKDHLQTAELTHNFILRSLEQPEKRYLQVPSTRLALQSPK